MRVLLKMFLFLLPWQTIWIFREVFVGGIKSEYSTLGFYATEALLWVVVLLFMWWYFKKCRLQNADCKISWPLTRDRIFVLSVLSLISYLLLSLIWSVDRSLALQQSLHVIEAFLLFFILLLGPLKKEEAVKWLVLGSVLPCILGIWQFLTQSTFASTWLGLALHPAWQGGTSVVASETIGRWLRAYGTFSHPNVFGGYIATVLLLYCFFVKNEKVWLRLIPTKYGIPYFIGITYNLLLTTLFFTFSRSAWVAAVVSCILYLITYNLYQKNKLHVTRYMLQILLISILIITFFPLVKTRVSGNSISESYSITDRVSGYSDAWKLFKQHPVLGVGAGNYTLYEAQPVHNALVLFVVETGVVGVLLLLFVIVSFSRLMTQKTRSNSLESCYLGRVSCLLLFTIYFLLSLFDHYLYSSYIGLMLSALFFGLILRKSDENTVSPQLVHRNSFDTLTTACHNTPTRLR